MHRAAEGTSTCGGAAGWLKSPSPDDRYDGVKLGFDNPFGIGGRLCRSFDLALASILAGLAVGENGERGRGRLDRPRSRDQARTGVVGALVIAALPTQHCALGSGRRGCLGIRGGQWQRGHIAATCWL